MPAGQAYNPTHFQQCRGEVTGIYLDPKSNRLLVTDASVKFTVFTHPQGEIQHDISTPLKVVFKAGITPSTVILIGNDDRMWSILLCDLTTGSISIHNEPRFSPSLISSADISSDFLYLGTVQGDLLQFSLKTHSIASN